MFITCFAGIARAAEDAGPGLFENWFAAVKRTAASPSAVDVYRPLTVYHMRWNYSDEDIARYNEEPGGFGVGLSRVEGHIEHSLTVMGFTDSNYYFQGVAGYGWLARVWGPEKFFNIGGGYTITLQMRHEYYYVPLPLPLPMAGIDAGPLSVQTAYVPGWPGMGNVAIVWARLKIPFKYFTGKN